MEMNNEKRNRIMAAVTVASVLLIVIIVAILIYQICEICILSSRKKEMEKEYQTILEEQSKCEDWLDYYYNHEDEVMYTLILQQYGAGVLKK